MRRRLFGIQLDDKMLFDFLFNVASFGQFDYLTGEGSVVEFKPLRKTDGISRFELFENLLVFLVFLYRDNVALLYEEGRNIYAFAVDGDETVVDDLSCLCSAGCEAQTEYYVVESSFEKDEHVVTGDASHGLCLIEITLELLFAKSVDSLGLLLLSELYGIAGSLLSCGAVLTGSGGTLSERALLRNALSAFEEQLYALASALTTIGSCIFSHVIRTS